MQSVLIIIISAAFSVALAKSIERAPIPEWMEWGVLTAMLLAAVLLFVGVLDSP